MSSLFNGYLVFDHFQDQAVKLAFFKWYGNTKDRSLHSLTLLMQQRFKCNAFYLLTLPKLEAYMKAFEPSHNAFIVFEVVDNIVGDPIE